MPCVMTALDQLAPEFLVVSSNPTRIDRIRGGAVAEDLQVAWIGDHVRFERQ
jgi:hypothetical protein